MKTLFFITLIVSLISINELSAASVKTDSFSKASVVIPISNIQISGKDAELTIIKNARNFQSRVDKADYFALKKENTPPSTVCPMTTSSDIDRTVKNYNMFTGKAKISVSFKDATVAKQAMSQNCLLIKNNGT